MMGNKFLALHYLSPYFLNLLTHTHVHTLPHTHTMLSPHKTTVHINGTSIFTYKPPCMHVLLTPHKLKYHKTIRYLLMSQCMAVTDSLLQGLLINNSFFLWNPRRNVPISCYPHVPLVLTFRHTEHRSHLRKFGIPDLTLPLLNLQK